MHSLTIHFSREIAPGRKNGTRIAPTCVQSRGPQYFKPELRRGLKERQETSARQRQQDKQREWADWERQVAEEEASRRQKAAQRSQRSQQAQFTPRYIPRPAEEYEDPYQPAVQTSEEQDRIERLPRPRRRRRQADQWTPPSPGDSSSIAAAQEAKARAASADSAAAAAFLQGQVRRKASRFADLVDFMKESQAKRDPFRNRREDPEAVSTRKNTSTRRSRSRSRFEDTNLQQWDGGRRSGDILGPQEAEVEVVGMSYLPPDVVRVSREPPPSLSSSATSNRGGYGEDVFREEEDGSWKDMDEEDARTYGGNDRTMEEAGMTRSGYDVFKKEGENEEGMVESLRREEMEWVEQDEDEYMDW